MYSYVPGSRLYDSIKSSMEPPPLHHLWFQAWLLEGTDRCVTLPRGAGIDKYSSMIPSKTKCHTAVVHEQPLDIQVHPGTAVLVRNTLAYHTYIPSTTDSMTKPKTKPSTTAPAPTIKMHGDCIHGRRVLETAVCPCHPYGCLCVS